MLHYTPQHVSSSTLLIIRRTNCIITASGIVTLCKQSYSMRVESTVRLHKQPGHKFSKLICCSVLDALSGKSYMTKLFAIVPTGSITLCHGQHFAGMLYRMTHGKGWWVAVSNVRRETTASEVFAETKAKPISMAGRPTNATILQQNLHTDYILITNLMHWWLFIHKILFSSRSFEPPVLIFRRIQLYTRSIWYCHSLWEFLVACQYTDHAVYRQATRNSHREWQYHMLHV